MCDEDSRMLLSTMNIVLNNIDKAKKVIVGDAICDLFPHSY